MDNEIEDVENVENTFKYEYVEEPIEDLVHENVIKTKDVEKSSEPIEEDKVKEVRLVGCL